MRAKQWQKMTQGYSIKHIPCHNNRIQINFDILIAAKIFTFFCDNKLEVLIAAETVRLYLNTYI